MKKQPRGVPAGSKLARTASARRDERWYALGERRTTAEPLAASWRPQREPLDGDEANPEVEPDIDADAGDPDVDAEVAPDTGDAFSAGSAESGRRGAGFLSAYGWRIYAVPVLVVLTVLVLVNTSRSQPSGASDASTNAAGAAAPLMTEQPATSANALSGTAVLPDGGYYPQAGAGTWRVLAGSGPIIGKAGGRLYHFQIAVEDGIDPSVYQGDDAFTGDVQATLADTRSWVGSGTIQLQRVAGSYPNPDFIISLTTPNTDHRPDLCGFSIQYEGSCWVATTRRVVINVARWVRGALAFNGDLGLYRQYAINHEVGHVFGNHHVGCATNGGLAPVMMEQSFGVSDDYVYDVNDPEPTNRGKVVRDGRVCRVNAWPYPQGASYSPNNPPS